MGTIGFILSLLALVIAAAALLLVYRQRTTAVGELARAEDKRAELLAFVREQLRNEAEKRRGGEEPSIMVRRGRLASRDDGWEVELQLTNVGASRAWHVSVRLIRHGEYVSAGIELPNPLLPDEPGRTVTVSLPRGAGTTFYPVVSWEDDAGERRERFVDLPVVLEGEGLPTPEPTLRRPEERSEEHAPGVFP